MHRTLLALAITASLFTPGLLEPLWSLLDSLWDTSASGGAGCIMDPSGRCQPDPQPQSDEGCGMDPSGCPQGS